MGRLRREVGESRVLYDKFLLSDFYDMQDARVMKGVTALVFLAVISIVVGCGPARPKEMPETAPCTVTVTQAGQPMADVVVSLYREGGNGSMLIEGTTNTSGVAKIRTRWGDYTTNGAPVGTHKVTVDKYVEVPPETVTPEESALWTAQQGEKYERERQALIDSLRIIPKQIADITYTPLSVSVVSSTGGSLTIEVNDYQK